MNLKPEKIIIKWLGSKLKELNLINEEIKNLNINNYYEPFVGGGSVFLNLHNKINNNIYINDNFTDLSYIYIFYKEKNKKFFNFLNYIINLFDNAVISEKIMPFYEITLKKTKRNNDITIKKIAIYTYIRSLYNDKNNSQELISAAFLFIRKYAYSGMFRYNKSGDFNVPYGGTGYDKNSLLKSFNYFKNYDFSKINIDNLDFYDFFNKYKNNFTKKDLIFIDPPYDDSFDAYNGNSFLKQQQILLKDTLEKYSNNINILAIMKGTPFIVDLYKNFNIIKYDFNYSVNFKNRNNKKFQHILIKNY